MSLSNAGHIFISYRSLEAEFALQLAADLRNAGVNIWVDRLDCGIQAGEDWRRSLERAIDGCSALIAVMSPSYLAATYCRNELARAEDKGCPVIPVLLHELPDGKPIEVQRIQHVDFTQWRDEAAYSARFEQLMRVLGEHAQAQIGARPDPEHRYLTTLIARFEANRGVDQYVDLLGEVYEQVERAEIFRRSQPSIIASWGLDPEFSSLENSSRALAPDAAPPPKPYGVEQVRLVAVTKERLVILGEPGAGKTTTLRRLALDAARDRLANPRMAPLPVYIELPRWANAGTPSDLVQAHWPLTADPAGALATGEAVLYLDGLNEMGDTGAEKAKKLREWIDGEHGPKRLIVTCRRDDYAGAFDLGLTRVVVQPLDDQRIRRIAFRFLGDDAHSFLHRVEGPDLTGLASNPYLLTVLMVLQGFSGELPRNKGTLFLRLARQLWNRERLRKTPGWTEYSTLESAFSKLAFTMIDDGMPIYIPRDVALQHLKSRDLIHLGVSTNLLLAAEDKIRFYHQLVQESFAAVELLRLSAWDRIGPPDYTGASAMSSARTERRAGKWDEVVLAACGISGDNADKILQAIAPIDPYLAQKCIEAGAVPSIESHLAIIFGLDRQVGKFESTIASCEAAMEEYGCYPPNRGYDEAQAAAAWSHEAINQTEAAIERQGDSLIADVRAQRIPDQLTPSIIRALKIIDTGPARILLQQAADTSTPCRD